MHYYQFNIGDYKSHTEHLSEMEDLTYRRLLDWYYLHESPIPLDESEVARQIRMRSHSDCIAVVLREYFELTDDGWIHHRANKELAKAGEKSSKASQSAKARWDKKPNKNKDLAVDANALRTQSEGNATHNTEHITQNTEHKKELPQGKPAKFKRKTSISDDFSVSQRVKDWAKQKGFDKLDEHLDAFTRKAKMNGYQYLDWDLAFMEAVREDWAKIRGKQSFAQQAADIARTTVPAQHAGRDPVLIKIEQERLRAVPPTVEQLEKMAALRRSIAK
jgi:uncharacterized protein YdaU (DUF1376 family)